ncbi:hypothetical protein WR25_06970 [Diploscapter pachys]|uniref:Uncharacterized protein n=1 Tax=Diploscapter pachys TaxID=2018661 RepID=A0A2A2K3M2_9BILA|nr:hypothetical protein WR25_06970 [Diploscapter pachys]
MDLPPVQPTTEPGKLHCTLNELPTFEKIRYIWLFCLFTMNVEWAYNSIWSRYDGIHSFDNDDLHNTWLHVVNTDYNDHIDTYNHVHVHIDVHNNYIHHNNNNYIHHNNNYYNQSLFRKFISIS